MKNLFVISLAVCLLAGGCLQKEKQVDIQYDVRFPNAAHNEAEITLTLSKLNPIPVQINMSQTSPGRYALHGFAKNVYGVLALDGEGDTLKIDRPDLHTWIVSGHNGTVKFSYTLYGNRADGTYSGINREHAHLNMPATFAWAQALKGEKITVQFHPPKKANWNVATQLKPTDQPYTFTAPNFYYFMDSPTELSNFDMRSWTVAADTVEYTIRLAVHHQGTAQQLDRFTKMAQKVVAEQVAVFGEPPAYDFGTYTFIADYLPYVYGDGMEHRNSTILTSRRSLGEGAMQNLGTLSHEFFHSWNVERIRPETLKPFDFTDPNISGALWFAEGFTSYYDDLVIRRTGLMTNQEFAQNLAGTLNYVLLSPGRKFYSPVEMSKQALFVDAATSIDPQNKANTFISYYSWGTTLGLGLDLMLRSEFENLTLDDYMRAMWQQFGKPEIAYNLKDLQQTLAEVTDSIAFAATFFDQHIYNSQPIDFKPLLAQAGFLLQRAHPGQAVIHLGRPKISFAGGQAIIAANTTIGGPLYNAGLDGGDEILKIDGKVLKNGKALQQLLAAHAPGDSLGITFRSLGEVYEHTLVLAEDPTLEIVLYEQTGKTVTPAMHAFREAWLGSKVV